MKVSVIIPVYNTEKYLKECLDSVINQTYKDIEIIIINDGSTDNSLNIIKDYAKNYDNIIYKNQKNKGQSAARNKGLKCSSGNYIMFVDSDDYLDLTMVEKLMTPFIKNKELDVSFCDYYLKSQEKLIQDFIIKFKNDSIKKALILSAPSPCLKIFKKELLDNFFFPENIIYEDYASIPLVLTKVQSLQYIQEHLYYYRQHSESTTRNQIYNEKKLDIIKASQYLYDGYLKSSIQEYKEEIEYLIIEHLIFLGGLRFCRYPQPIKKLKLIKKFVNENNIIIDNNKYYKGFSRRKKQIIRNILNNNLLACYLFIIKRKILGEKYEI